MQTILDTGRFWEERRRQEEFPKENHLSKGEALTVVEMVWFSILS